MCCDAIFCSCVLLFRFQAHSLLLQGGLHIQCWRRCCGSREKEAVSVEGRVVLLAGVCPAPDAWSRIRRVGKVQVARACTHASMQVSSGKVKLGM